MTRTTPESFWARVDIRAADECWEWTGTVSLRGYGHVGVAGVPTRVHRYAYTLSAGAIPEGLVVRHTCDNPPCCNPAHLLLGTQRDNLKDMFDRGRARPPVGEAHPSARLTEVQVRELRDYSGPLSERKLAPLYGVSRGAVNGVRSRRTWRHVA